MKKVKLLGTACRTCHTLAELVTDFARERQLDIELEEITQIDRIVEFGAVTMPALVVNGHVVLAGKIPSREDLARHLA